MASGEPKHCEPKPKPVSPINLFKVDLLPRVLLTTTAAVAVAVMVSSQETKTFGGLISIDARFNYSPALIYFVVANSVACLYGVFTTLASFLCVSKPSPATELLFILSLFDTLMVGVVASATGAGASIAYIGLKGNSHVGWLQICNFYGKFCRHVGISIAFSLVASVALIVLVSISAYSLHRRST
ncbi:CASP-like protein 1D1 [Asparagus officinalis]|uniref:CASP-like protein 1D1 n=1 Tax=Asparagus officinalis TaxID=4686 RepID=UPI00098E313A|nr:CASP-like protein 1D1 [Asparagus officinalis]